MAATQLPEVRTRARRGLAAGVRILAVLALCTVRFTPPTQAAGSAAGLAARLAPASLARDGGSGHGRDALPLAAVAVAFVVLRGWRREKAAGYFG
jgi:hypothetical protein